MSEHGVPAVDVAPKRTIRFRVERVAEPAVAKCWPLRRDNSTCRQPAVQLLQRLATGLVERAMRIRSPAVHSELDEHIGVAQRTLAHYKMVRLHVAIALIPPLA